MLDVLEQAKPRKALCSAATTMGRGPKTARSPAPDPGRDFVYWKADFQGPIDRLARFLARTLR